jgi:oligopeptide/dipeptide ABC transporter ATP-binding protein
MYLGRIVETSLSAELYLHPLHPYTRALLSAVPIPDPAIERARKRVRAEGDVPPLAQANQGCPFHDRCPHRMARCRTERPELQEASPGHEVTCFLYHI